MAMARPLRHKRKKPGLFVAPVLQLHVIKTMAFVPKREVNGNNSSVRALGKQGRLTEALHLLHFIDPLVDSSTCASLLQECLHKKALPEAKLVHAHMTARAIKIDVFLGTILVTMYAKCGTLVDARGVFDQMLRRNAVSWTVMIAAYARHGFGEEALNLFHQMQRTGIQPNHFTFASVLPACANVAALKDVHVEIIKKGFQSDVFVASALVDTYAKCGSIVDAGLVFDKMPQRNVVSWNTMIAVYAQNGQVDEALRIFEKMPERNVVSWNAMIAGYAHNGRVGEAQKLFEKMPERNVISWNTMIAGYAQNGFVEEAMQFFRKSPERNVVSWNAMIAGYEQNGYGEKALKLFQQMKLTGVTANANTFASVLPACAELAALEQGKEIHEEIVESGFQSDVFLESALVGMYAKCESMENARKVFDNMNHRDVVSWNAMIAGYAQNGRIDEAHKLFQNMPKRNVVSWNVMIAGYTQNGHGEKALELFKQMQRVGLKPNLKTFASVLPACAKLALLEEGKEIHEEIIRTGFQSDVFVESALVDMYAKCGSIDNAHNVFNKMHQRNVVSWNAMIAGYAQNGRIDGSWKLFQNMPERNVVSWNAMIAGCAQNGHVEEALRLFHKMPERNMVSWNAMITGYIQNGFVDDAMKLFQEMPEQSEVSWNAMIAGYAQNGEVDLALEFFQKMPERNVASWNAIIMGFARNGYLDEALKLFQQMPEHTVASWNAMIAGYTQNGHGEEALNLFRQMQLAGVKPNSKTFTSVLPACAHLASLEQGKVIHEEIIISGFQSDIFVGSALVDMYAKCGNLENACTVFNKMHQQDAVLWNAMIAGYAMHGHGKEALKLFEQMKHSGTNPDRVTLVGILSACCHAGLVDEGLQYFNCMREYYHIKLTMEHYGCMVDLLGRAGLLDEAKDFISKMPIKPDATVWGCLLGACRIHHNIVLAENVAEQIFELDPENASPYVLLSNIYAAAGRWEDIEKVRIMMKDRRVKKKPGCSWIEVNKHVYAFLVGDISHPQPCIGKA
eukprot:Gb_40749 [translate_table: standard]